MVQNIIGASQYFAAAGTDESKKLSRSTEERVCHHNFGELFALAQYTLHAVSALWNGEKLLSQGSVISCRGKESVLYGAQDVQITVQW